MEWDYLREALSRRYSERILAQGDLRALEEDEVVGLCPRCGRPVFGTSFKGYCSSDCEAS